MKIEHIAIWSRDIEKLKNFYIHYFGASTSEKYVNPKKNFQSYFLCFDDGCRLELMQMPGIPDNLNNKHLQSTGIIHFAISVGSKEAVDTLTELLRRDGFEIAGEPRTTGDGYYESVIFDPEGNRIEITI
jgi:lactoylglutathione lyase